MSLCSPKVWATISVVLIATCLLLPPVSAQNPIFKTVNCDDPAQADFGSIQEALDTSDWHQALELEVTGTCHERLFIGDGIFARNSVSIHAPAGQRAAITPAANQGKGVVITIGGARGISFSALDISGGARGVMVFDSSEVDFDDVTIENNSAEGVQAQGGSIIFFGRSRIRNNGTYGVNISPLGTNTVYLFSAEATNPTVVEGNGQYGVFVGLAGVATLGGYVSVRNNGGSTTAINHGGIFASRNSTVQMVQTASGLEVAGNTGNGILAEVNSSLSLGGVTIQNNSDSGVRVNTRSVLELTAPNTFASNGTADVSCDAWSLVTGDLTGVQNLNCKMVNNPKNDQKK